MNCVEINGVTLKKMMCGALQNIRACEKETNDMNVFPVPDGDTGTNLRRTLEAGVQTAGDADALNAYLKGLSSGMLLGARGNSGVIFSQIFAGIYDALSRYPAADADNLFSAFAKGYKWAYASVIRPVEGTILTVLREGIKYTKEHIYKKAPIDLALEIFIGEMNRALSNTPELLPVLKEAGVVDSGGFGLIKIVEGMLKALRGEEIAETEQPVEEEQVAFPAAAFDENSAFEYGYCTEFMLQLMNGKRAFERDLYVGALQKLGDSLAVVQNDTRVRVHIHTFAPEKVIEMSREYGEFTMFKLENMQVQHNELPASAPEKRKFALLAVADGDGFCKLYREQGCDCVLDGGRTMNTSVKEFLSAYRELNAETLVVVPNDKNVVFAAEQAAKMYQEGKIVILPTEDMVQGYFALASDLPDAPADDRIESMRTGTEGIVTVAVVRCSKNRVLKGVEYKDGSYAALIGGEIALSDGDAVSAVLRAVAAIPDIGEKEQVVVFQGKNFCDGQVLEERLQREFPALQVYLIDGGQNSDELLLGIS